MYDDVTKYFYNKAIPKSNNVLHAKEFVTETGEVYKVNIGLILLC